MAAPDAPSRTMLLLRKSGRIHFSALRLVSGEAAGRAQEGRGKYKHLLANRGARFEIFGIGALWTFCLKGGMECR